MYYLILGVVVKLQARCVPAVAAASESQLNTTIEATVDLLLLLLAS